MQVLLVVVQHVYHPVTAVVKSIHRLISDDKIEPGHDDFNILPDEGVIFLEKDLIEHQIKGQYKLIDGDQ